MSKKIISILVAVAIVSLGAGGFAGYSYAHMARGSFENQARLGQNGTMMMEAFAARGMRDGANGGFVGGEIISKDATSITVKVADGGSKIILLSGSTPITKATSGTPADLAVGTQITATGSTNADGSITAQSIQIRPAGISTSTPIRNGQ